jgi:hypothetical protein
MRRRRGSIAASPLLIGAITTLIVVVAVFLSYNANNGLPFVPTYNIKVALPNASGLQPSNQVRIAGTRVGLVSKMTPYEDPRTGTITAIATLKLEKKIEPLPADTRAIVQSVSAIGLKYLELEKGSSHETLKADHTIPLAQVRDPVNIEELFNMFDKPTRTAIKINTNNFGNGLAGRGLGLNNTIAELRPLVTNAVPVLHNLALPQTSLRELFIALERASGQAAPVATQQAAFFTEQDIFFREWATVTKSLEEATVGGPPSLEQAIHSLPFQAPLIEKSTEFMRLLHPSATSLRTVAPELGHAFRVGAVNLSKATELNSKLAESSQALAAFAQNPVAAVGLEDLTNTLAIGTPLIAGVAPEQAYCNYITLAFRNVSSLESENIGVGSVARSGFILAPSGNNNEGYPSSAPANGPSEEKNPITKQVFDNGANHLHANPYPNVAGPGQAKLCEAGNETYVPRQPVVGNAANSASNREITSREQGLTGEKYPQGTLKALGLVKAPAQGKKK